LSVSKAAKRARKKEGRQARIEAEKKAASRRRTRNRNIVLGTVFVLLAGYLTLTHFLAKPKVTTAACSTAKPPRGATVSQTTAPPMTVSQSKTYTATIVTSCGTMVASLDVKDSPNTVNEFVYLADKGFYNGLTFHRIVKDFAIQGGDPTGTGSGGPGFEVTDTVPSGFKYTKGVLAMANAGTTGGAAGQFFVVPADSAASKFQPLYAVLGKVTSGLDTVDKLNAVKTVANSQGEVSQPAEPVYIDKVTVASS
jgi:cyclophilin family peptidyl-prolyl cis-trans isomerase